MGIATGWNGDSTQRFPALTSTFGLHTQVQRPPMQQRHGEGLITPLQLLAEDMGLADLLPTEQEDGCGGESDAQPQADAG